MKVNEHTVHLCKIYYYLVVRDTKKNTSSLGINITSVLINFFLNVSHMFYALSTVI